jgi:hypothetical protein
MPATVTMPDQVDSLFPSSNGYYRLWTVGNGLDFDALPAYSDGGPPIVTVGGWIVSTSTTTRVRYDGGASEDDGMHTLSVWRGDHAKPEQHPLCGTKYLSRRDADRAAYQAGVAAFMVYDRDTFRLGLPTVILPGMELGPLLGKRVRIARDVPGYGRCVHHGVFYKLWHSERHLGDVGGMLHEEPHAGCRGGDTAFTMPYHTTIVTAA